MKMFAKIVTIICLIIWIIEFVRFVFTEYQLDSFMIGLAVVNSIFYYIGFLFDIYNVDTDVVIKGEINIK